MPPLFHTLDDLDVKDKTIIARMDFNVPLTIDGEIADDSRLKAHLVTIQEIQKKGGKQVLLSHLGRPKGRLQPHLSLKKVAIYLSKLLGTEVKFSPNLIGEEAQKMKQNLKAGEVLLLENTRFYAREKTNDDEFAKELAKNGDIYINDAFSCAHRKHASLVGITNYLPKNGVGRVMERELSTLRSIIENPKPPLLVIIGGAKISSKIGAIKYLIPKADQIIIGGAMANTFLAAGGYNVGKSMHESEYVNIARETLTEAGVAGCRILLPSTVVVAKKLEEGISYHETNVQNVVNGDLILDIAPSNVKNWESAINSAGTILWNGPIGAFETKPFDRGSLALARLVANSKAFTVAGGGDTLSLLTHGKLTSNMDYISTAGGALLELLEGRELPALKALKTRTLGIAV